MSTSALKGRKSASVTFLTTADLQVALQVCFSRQIKVEEAESVDDLKTARRALDSHGHRDHCGIYFLNAELFRRQTGLDIFLQISWAFLYTVQLHYVGEYKYQIALWLWCFIFILFYFLFSLHCLLRLKGTQNGSLTHQWWCNILGAAC